MKLPWSATVGLIALVALVGLYAYLHHERRQRRALKLEPVDADELA